MGYEYLFGVLPLTTLVASFIMPLINYSLIGNKKIIQAIAVIASLIPLIISFKIVELAFSNDNVLVYRFGGWPPPIGIVYVLDKMNSLLILTTTFLMFLIVIYSYDYLKQHNGLGWYYTLYFGLETGLLGVLLTGDVFNLFVMIEVVSVASYSLVMFYRHRGDSIAAGLKYAFIGSLGTTIYFLALGIIYGVYGTVNLFDLTTKTHGYPYPFTGLPVGDIVLGSAIALVLVSWTFMIKSGVFPNHFWLPDAHPAAPTPISAILSGLVVNVGVYAMYRYIYVIYGGELGSALNLVLSVISTILLITGSLSAIVGSLLMHFQMDIKRIIAYSTVMHMGYLFMAIGVKSSLGATAFILHIINHSIAKATLFLAAGVFIYAVGSRRLDRLGGLAYSLPLSTFALVISGLNLAGVPPLPVFYSKLLLFNALFQYHVAYAIILVVTSAIALIAYIRLLYVVLFGRKIVKKVKKTPNSFRLVLILLTLIMIVCGISITYLLDQYIYPAAQQSINITNYMIKP